MARTRGLRLTASTSANGNGRRAIIVGLVEEVTNHGAGCEFLYGVVPEHCAHYAARPVGTDQFPVSVLLLLLLLCVFLLWYLHPSRAYSTNILPVFAPWNQTDQPVRLPVRTLEAPIADFLRVHDSTTGPGSNGKTIDT